MPPAAVLTVEVIIVISIKIMMERCFLKGFNTEEKYMLTKYLNT